jgi:hypothetical protein
VAVVVNICNPSYVGGRDQEGLSWRPTWAKVREPYLKKKLGMEHTYDPSCFVSLSKLNLGKNMKFYL